jgi:hypothetical protein
MPAERAAAAWPFDATLPAQVSLAKGDVVTIIKRVDDAWAKVEKDDGTQGLVPSAYIKEIIEEVRAIVPHCTPSPCRRSFSICPMLQSCVPCRVPCYVPCSPATNALCLMCCEQGDPPSPSTRTKPSQPAPEPEAAGGVEHVEAAWEFKPTGPGQLKMKKGDVLQVVNRPSADWVTVKNPSTSEQVRPCIPVPARHEEDTQLYAPPPQPPTTRQPPPPLTKTTYVARACVGDRSGRVRQGGRSSIR